MMSESNTSGDVGNAQARIEAEARALLRVPIELRRNEADLFESKWFDYRSLHPTQATYLFVECYAAAVRQFCELAFDRDRSTLIKTPIPGLIFETRESTAFTMGRQALDGVGCRYDWALSVMVHRFSDRGWRGMPRPNQIYSEELILDVRDAWRVECNASLQIPKTLKHTPGQALTHTQRDYMTWVFRHIRERNGDHWRPLSRLFSEKLVTEEAARLEFDQATVDRALRVAG
jgi:hypothetical protein